MEKYLNYFERSLDLLPYHINLTSSVYEYSKSMSLTYLFSDLAMCCAVLNCLVVSDSLRPYGLQPAGSSVHGISTKEY